MGTACEQWNYVYQNGFRSRDYIDSARLYEVLSPDVILPGHDHPYWVSPEFFHKNRERGEVLHRLHRELLPWEEVDFGAEGKGAWLRPYRCRVGPGESVLLEAEVRNPFPRRCDAVVVLVVPEGWRAEPLRNRIVLPPKGTGTCSFRVIPASVPVRRARVGFDTTIGDSPLGVLAEALITVG